MASEWYYRLGGQEIGPIAYRELIQLVRDGLIREEDLVRGEWPADWQRADSVVGLFHMAQKQLVAAGQEQEVTSEVAPDSGNDLVFLPSAPSLMGRFFWFLQVLFRRTAASAPETMAPRSDGQTGQDVPKVAASTTRACAPVSAPLVAANDRVDRIADPKIHGEDINLVEQSRHELTVEGEGTVVEGVEETDRPVEADQLSEAIPAARGRDEWASTVADAIQAAEARDAAFAQEQEKVAARDRARGMVHALLAWPIYLVTRPILYLFGWLIGTGRTQTRDQVAAGLSVLESWLPRPVILRIGFKVGAAVVAANLTAFGILKWSDRQALRFPGTDSEMGRAFPIIGECDPAEFGFLVFQAALLAGIAAYAAAAVMEAGADD